MSPRTATSACSSRQVLSPTEAVSLSSIASKTARQPATSDRFAFVLNHRGKASFPSRVKIVSKLAKLL